MRLIRQVGDSSTFHLEASRLVDVMAFIKSLVTVLILYSCIFFEVGRW